MKDPSTLRVRSSPFGQICEVVSNEFAIACQVRTLLGIEVERQTVVDDDDVPVVEVRPDLGINWGLYSAEEKASILVHSQAELTDLVNRQNWSSLINEKAAAMLIKRCFGSGDITQHYIDAINREIEKKNTQIHEEPL